MAMNIKSEEAQRLAHKLSELTGETITKAVTEALRGRIEQVEKAREPGLADRLIRIGQDCSAHLKEPYRSTKHGELLYDEQGLPK